MSGSVANSMHSHPELGDARFFERRGPFSAADLAEVIGSAPPENPDDRRYVRVAPLQLAGPTDVSFLDNRKYIPALEASHAGLVIVHPSMVSRVPQGCVALPTREPYLAWAKIANLFHPLPPVQPSIDPTAIIHPTAQVDETAQIGPYVIVEAEAKIGPRGWIAAHAVIGKGVVIGTDCRIGASATVSHAILGNRVVLFPGVRIGQDGFGFATTMTPTGPRHISVPQLGRVVIEDDVEIGANACVDRGSAQDTVVGAGTRIDNLVQIGHNVRIGRCCVIVAQVGISGSAVLEDFVALAGQVGVAGHLRIGRAARVAGQAGVISDLAGGVDYMGMPAQPAKAFLRQVAVLKRLAARKSGGAEADTAQDGADRPKAETSRD